MDLVMTDNRAGLVGTSSTNKFHISSFIHRIMSLEQLSKLKEVAYGKRVFLRTS